MTRRRVSEQERLDEKTGPKWDDTERCWQWTAYRNDDGYGQICILRDGRKRIVGAHRLSYELNVGPIPQGMHVLHRCDMPWCVRPSHLMLGTHSDNMRDMWAKKRHPHRTGPIPGLQGENHFRSKLTSDDVRRIRRLAAQKVPQSAIATIFGISQGNVSKIVLRYAWAHVA